MSGPYSFTVTLISGQKDSSLLVVGSSAFLYVGWMSLDLISINNNFKEEIYLCLDVFSKRGHFTHQPNISHAKSFAKRMHKDFSDSSILENLFSIALDKQGYLLAEEFFNQKGISPNEKVYGSVCKLNLVKQPMPPYPENNGSLEFWNEVRRNLYKIDREHKEVTWEVGKQALYEEYVPVTALEKKYYSWYKLLQENLLPWRYTIQEIQSAMS